MTDAAAPDKDATTNREIFLECAERLKLAQTAESENRIQAINDLEFRDGNQWPSDIANDRRIENRPSLTSNIVGALRNRIFNALKEQRPRIKAHPVGDGADIDKAEVVNGLIRHIEACSRASVAYDTGGGSALDIGWGYWRIVPEYISEDSMDQELRIAAIRNTFTVYMDPSAQMPDGSDADWFILTEKIKRTEYKRRYPNAKNVNFQQGSAGDESVDWDSAHEIRLAEYYRIVQTREVLYRMSDGSTAFKSDLPAPETMQQAGLDFARDENGDPISRVSARRTVYWHHINGQEVIETIAQKGRWIPVVLCEGNALDINGEVRRKGMIRDLIDPARMKNYWDTMLTEVIALSPKAPWVGAEGQFDGHPEWNDANQRSYSRLEYKMVTSPEGNPAPPPQRQAPVGVPEGIVAAAQGAEHNLMSVAGMPHDPSQDPPGVVSGAAMRQRARLTDISHFQYYDNQTFSIAHTGRILLDLIPYYYDTARTQRIIGDDGVPKMVGINQQQPSQANPAIMEIKNDLRVGRYDVVMDTGPGYDTRRQEGAESMIGLMTTPLGEVIVKSAADLVLRAQDFPYAQEIADRLAIATPDGMEKALQGMPESAKNIVSALQGKVQQLTQELQQSQMDVKYGLTRTLHQEATKLQVETMHDKRAESDTRTDAATKQFDTELRAHTAVEVATIQQEGTMLNTNVEAAHNRVAAKELAKSAERAERSVQ